MIKRQQNKDLESGWGGGGGASKVLLFFIVQVQVLTVGCQVPVQSDLLLCYSHPGTFSPAILAHNHLRAFALAICSTWSKFSWIATWLTHSFFQVLLTDHLFHGFWILPYPVFFFLSHHLLIFNLLIYPLLSLSPL